MDGRRSAVVPQRKAVTAAFGQKLGVMAAVLFFSASNLILRLRALRRACHQVPAPLDFPHAGDQDAAR